jgi:MFS family permease
MGHYGIQRGTAALLSLRNAGYLPSVLASGMLCDRLGRRAFQTLGAGLFAVAGLVCAGAPPFLALLPAFACLGFAPGILDPGLRWTLLPYVLGLTVLSWLAWLPFRRAPSSVGSA